MKITSTLLGLALVTACSASQADAGLFDWLTPGYYAPRSAATYYPSSSYASPANGSQCGPNGCSPCANGRCGTSVRPTTQYGYGAATPTYYPSTSYPSTSYYGPSQTTPCTTGQFRTAPNTAPQRYTPAYNSVTPSYNYGGNGSLGVNGNPYYGGY